MFKMPIGNDDINIWYCCLFFVRLLVVLVKVKVVVIVIVIVVLVVIVIVVVVIVDLYYDVTIVINDLLLLDWF